MNKQVLSIEQMRHLEELGLDITDASMYWFPDKTQPQPLLTFFNRLYQTMYKEKNLGIPAYTLQDILEKLPNEIVDNTGTYNLVMLYPNNIICYEYNDSNGEFDHFVDTGSCDSILNSAYSSFCWCIEKGYIKIK